MIKIAISREILRSGDFQNSPEIGPSSYEASHSYDELGRISETTHDDSSSKKTVHYEYDSAGNLKKITVAD